jgi:hypothetical protein
MEPVKSGCIIPESSKKSALKARTKDTASRVHYSLKNSIHIDHVTGSGNLDLFLLSPREVYGEIEDVFRDVEKISLMDASDYRLYRLEISGMVRWNADVRSVLFHALIDDRVKSFYEILGFEFSI